MAPSDMLFFYTDGLIEAVNRASEMYRDSRLIGLLDTLADTSPRDVLRVVFDDWRHHCEGVPVDDDISMLALCTT
jgi:serine phosphatase RsbU (regulator of sigma subunit)